MGWYVGFALILLGLVILLIWWLRRRRKPEVTTYGKPANTTDAMWWLWQELQKLEPSTKLGGTYANKPGYHNIRQNLPSYDYSVCDRPPDDGGPSNVCAAIDWTFPDAQSGNYDRIAKYTKRLLASAQDMADPRLNGWREFYGNADWDSYVEGWDCRYGVPATSDSSHLWHIHISENRDQSESYDNKKALLSVLKGETVDQWLGLGIREGDGAVLLNCPYDEGRLDLLYIGETGHVMHRWWKGGMNTAWTTNTSNENLGGAIEVGTLTAAWAPDGNSMNIAGLGKGDGNTPEGCGQYWGMNLGRQGARTGWGSFEGAYGKLPNAMPTTTDVTVKENRDWGPLVVAIIAVLVAILAVVYTAWGPE